MATDFEKMIERYKTEIMKYKSDPINPEPIAEPQPITEPQPIEAPTPLPESVLESDIPIETGREADEGYLTIRVSTAQSALPIEGALATITSKEGDLIAVMLTDDDGKTRTVSLATAPRSESESPDNNRPFDTYNLEIKREGYFDFRSENIPIFGGVTNVQNISLVPLPEFNDDSLIIAQNTEPF